MHVSLLISHFHLASEKASSIEQLNPGVLLFVGVVFRHYKPFNPILGETFDAIRPEDGYCVVLEQVSTLVTAESLESGIQWGMDVILVVICMWGAVT